MLLGSLLVAAGPALLPSCAENNSTLFVAGVMVPDDDCSVTAEGDAKVHLFGTLDRAHRSAYFAALLVGNQLRARGDGDTLRTETNRVTLRGAVVTINSATGTTLDEFTTNVAGFVHPSDGDSPGWGAVGVTLLPAAFVSNLPAGQTELNVLVSVFGDTLGNDEVESSTFSFPIQICSDCRVDCSMANDIVQGDPCPSGMSPVTLACDAGQDNSFIPCAALSAADAAAICPI
jgi:hypothetical protein